MGAPGGCSVGGEGTLMGGAPVGVRREGTLVCWAPAGTRSAGLSRCLHHL